ncbi:autotransporter domain-containing protein [Nitrosospira sp. Is2]|uniref:autotransporter domain-containing protein n=1 Tax=Nitrosospira sp. Is2 TaxID=3080532 RepID=UPI0029553E3A|nr:autotransporter domain-containing protein [Nitrosospira sp. Is2]WON73530.1 autotransporter domain-containing protein [Nitrosospira sp. Is2]
MNKTLGHWIVALAGVVVFNPLQAQSFPQQSNTLLWANLDQSGTPTGAFVSVPQLAFQPSGSANGERYMMFVELGNDGQLNAGDNFQIRATSVPYLNPGAGTTGEQKSPWPGTTNGVLQEAYRLESTLDGTVTSVNGHPFINSNGELDPNPNDSFSASIRSGHIELLNAHTGGSITDLAVQQGTAVNIHFSPSGSLADPTEIVTVNGLLGPGCDQRCDTYIRMPDGSSIRGHSNAMTVSGGASVLSTELDTSAPTAHRLGLMVSHPLGATATFVVAGPVVPPPPQIPWLVFLNADNIMEGNNGNPMRTLLSPGQSSVGAVGSGGRNDHQGINGNLGNGQMRFAHNFGFAQFNVSAGGLWGGNNDAFRGDTTIRGAFVIPEVITKIPGTTVHITATGLYSPGEVNPDVSTLGGRVRADWLDAVKISKTGFTPYASYTYIHTSIKGFMDKTTPFYWDQHSDEVNTARYGLDAVIGVTKRINLLGRIEGAHRFEAHSNNITGRDMNGAGFSFAGLAYKQDWVRGAVGIEGKLGKNFVGVLLNATSQGPVTSYWATASYRAAF